MPLSYQGFGFTSILLMVAVLVIIQLVKHLRDHSENHHPEKK